MDETSTSRKGICRRSSGCRENEAVCLNNRKEFVVIVELQVRDPWRRATVDHDFVQDIELLCFEGFGTSFDGTIDCTCESHSHICSVSFIETTVEISVHV